mmetsp:Transcript_1378/g.3030  ORF Transcript_1378/g.3030 Transcript_1378/m.3030 type:complete len:94 (-) Transcript_1378:234-515(-)
MAAVAASSTQEGGAKSGSPTQRDVTDSPSASICLTREKTSTVLEGLIWDKSGLSGGGSIDSDVDVDDDDDVSVEDSEEAYVGRGLRVSGCNPR